MHRIWLFPLASAFLFVLPDLGPARATPANLEGLGIAVPTASLQFARYGGRGGRRPAGRGARRSTGSRRCRAWRVRPRRGRRARSLWLRSGGGKGADMAAELWWDAEDHGVRRRYGAGRALLGWAVVGLWRGHSPGGDPQSGMSGSADSKIEFTIITPEGE